MRFAVLLLGLIVTSCAAQRPRDCCPCEPKAERKLDEKLLSLLATARAYHHQADLYLQQGDTERALTAIRAILGLPLDGRFAEAEEVRLDATARLGKLLAAQGDDAQALAVVEQGLKTPARRSFFLANLHSVMGEILEARVKRLDASDKVGAKQAARQAIEAFERSIAINRELQRQLEQRKGRR